uniref:Eukaryotic translation initiation factor 3 subunit 7 n=1 Tax=Polytomella parva TaxID=51329 RepID=A0A7S0YMD9_9CHLO|mmetsp:Transcript_33401/g.60347  ORF Transcript_33401/g.60347 Transcript_33401/m.60347 type:complete len:527 (+) Transcript_33401:66-1646(+)
MSFAFGIPNIQDNPTGWGPVSVPEHLKDTPFAPFNKSDKIGRASDWTTQNTQRGRMPALGSSVFNFLQTEEEESFHVVDSRPVKTNRFPNNRNRYQQNQQNQQRNQQNQQQNKGQGRDDKKSNQHQKRPQYYGRDNQRTHQYSSSVEVRPEWKVAEQLPFDSFSQASVPISEPVDLADCGRLEFYDKTFDRITVKTSKPLEKTKRIFRSVTTRDDPIMKELASQNAGRVFATDNLIATLMAIKSSVYGWDILATRKGEQLFLDFRPDSNLRLLTVNENAAEPIPEDKDSINGIHQLSLEATAANQNFSQQVLVKDQNKYHEFGRACPFADQSSASGGFRYRKFALNKDKSLEVVVRCEVDAVVEATAGKTQFLSVKALNQHDFKEPDARRLERQPGSALLLEAKNNKNKMAKWTVCALLAGVEVMKLGWVVRGTHRDNCNHSILLTQTQKPKELAQTLTLKMETCWGIVASISELLLKKPEGQYLLVKDANKELLRLYEIPASACFLPPEEVSLSAGGAGGIKSDE